MSRMYACWALSLYTDDTLRSWSHDPHFRYWWLVHYGPGHNQQMPNAAMGFCPYCIQTWHTVKNKEKRSHCLSYSQGKLYKPSYSGAHHICLRAELCHSTLMIHSGVDYVTCTSGFNDCGPGSNQQQSNTAMGFCPQCLKMWYPVKMEPTACKSYVTLL